MVLNINPLRLKWIALCLIAGVMPASGDSLRLPNGEILIGRIVSETDESITFESTSVGVVTVAAEGAEVVRDDAHPAGKVPFPAPTAPTQPAPVAEAEAPPEGWLRKKLPRSISGSINVGFDMANTDVEVRNYLVEAGLGWKGEQNEVQTHHLYEYLSIDGNRATDTYENSIRWIRHLKPRWILLSQANWLRDEGMGIDYRIDALSVLGYYFVKTDAVTLLGGVGPSYEWEKWDRPGDVMTDNFNVAGYELFRYRFNPQLTFEQSFLGYVSPNDADDHRYHFEATLRQMLTPSVSIGLKYSIDYDNTPPPGFPDDQDRLTATVGYEF